MDAARVAWLPIMITAGALLSQRWPGIMRRISRCLAAVTGGTLLFVIAAGLAYRQGPVATTHRWLPHGLFIFIMAWSAIPFAIGVTLTRSGGRPFTAAARTLGLLVLLGVIFLASVTGYLGPSHGPVDAMTLRRFQVLHYAVWPSIAIVLVAWWYHSLRSDRETPTRRF